MREALLARYDDANKHLMNKEAAEEYALSYIGTQLIQMSRNGNPVIVKVQETFLHPITATTGHVLGVCKVQKGVNKSKRRMYT